MTAHQDQLNELFALPREYRILDRPAETIENTDHRSVDDFIKFASQSLGDTTRKISVAIFSTPAWNQDLYTNVSFERHLEL